MFIPVQFESVNASFAKLPGVYSVVCSHYLGADTERPQLLVFGYTPEGSTSASMYDLLAVFPGGEMRARDYVLMPDHCWRDSCGAKSVDIRALFPEPLLGLELIRRQELPIITIEAADV